MGKIAQSMQNSLDYKKNLQNIKKQKNNGVKAESASPHSEVVLIDVYNRTWHVISDKSTIENVQIDSNFK